MEPKKLKEFNEKLSALLKEYNVTLQVNHGINVVPLPEETNPVEELKKEIKDEK